MSLSITLSASDPLSISADVVVVGVVEGASPRAGHLGILAKALGPVVSRSLKRDEFTGKKDQTCELVTNGVIKPSRVVLVGLGSSQGSLSEAQVRVVAAKAARLALAHRAESLVIEVPYGVDGAERAMAEGVVLGSYRFSKYLTGDRLPKSSLQRVTLTTSAKLTPEARAEVELGRRVGESVCIARDLVNEPPNELYPESFAQFCRDMCKERGLDIKVLDDAALVKGGMKLMIAVGQGSVHKPRLVHMTYKPEGGSKGKKRLVFVGKGLTFDTGGICIKPAAGMEEMKGDMGGAANVVALMAALSLVKPDVEVHGLIGLAENMPDGNAYRPGDIFGSLDGKFVEIINTDAEGRLVLADVLAYGRALNPDLMLDNATLTGACVVALGTTVSAFYANQDALVDPIKDAARDAGEAMWHMPLVEELRDGLKSDWADLKHVADRWGGSITAALFLREFVGDAPWVHIDIAGPSMSHRAYGIYSKGGTAHGVLTFLKLVDQYRNGEGPTTAPVRPEPPAALPPPERVTAPKAATAPKKSVVKASPERVAPSAPAPSAVKTANASTKVTASSKVVKGSKLAAAKSAPLPAPAKPTKPAKPVAAAKPAATKAAKPAAAKPTAPTKVAPAKAKPGKPKKAEAPAEVNRGSKGAGPRAPIGNAVKASHKKGL
jgi:leucyl aminopeptidase